MGRHLVVGSRPLYLEDTLMLRTWMPEAGKGLTAGRQGWHKQRAKGATPGNMESNESTQT